MFTLGFVHLQEGETTAAERLFDSLIKLYYREAESRLSEAMEKWPQMGLRFGFILSFKRLGRIFRPWLQESIHIHILLRGGELYRAAEAWPEFDDKLRELKDSSNNGGPNPQLLLQIYLNRFPKGLADIVKVAAGPDQEAASKARDVLDLYLPKVSQIDDTLYELERKLMLASTDAVLQRPGSESTNAHAPNKPDLSSLEDSYIADLVPAEKRDEIKKKRDEIKK